MRTIVSLFASNQEGRAFSRRLLQFALSVSLSVPSPEQRFVSTRMPPKKKQRTTAANATNKGSSADATSSFFVILSPAKTLDLTSALEKDEPIPWSQPDCDLEKTNAVKTCMQDHASKATPHLAKLLGISKPLAERAQAYWKDFDTNDDYTPQPCGFLFQGAAYQGLDIQTLNEDTASLEYLQHHLRIVDPLWGWLRPMDVIPPYRLEMATKNIFGDKQKLAAYWKPSIENILGDGDGDDDDENHAVIINLASDEYSAAVPLKNAVKVIFRNKGRVIAVHAKRARGLYVRFLAQEKVTTLEDFWKATPEFTVEGYKYQEADSNQEDTVVYDRMTAPTPKSKAKGKK
jgi:cytoplasmic iron level regulating protein YaaA (DUF328/UPF0246 family)